MWLSLVTSHRHRHRRRRHIALSRLNTLLALAVELNLFWCEAVDWLFHHALLIITTQYTLSLDLVSISVYSIHMIKSKEIIKKIEAEGWYEVRQKGSHKHFRHEERPGTVTVPHPKSDMAIGTIKSIERQSGVKLV